MVKKNIVVTGCSSGIGLSTARKLAEHGDHIIMVCRDLNRGKKALLEIKDKFPESSLDLLITDLASQKEIRTLVNKLKRKYPQIDVLINNAGILPEFKSYTAEGFETGFAVNHIAPFLLTNLLLNSFRQGSRIVNVASDVHRNTTLDFENLNAEKSFEYLKNYGQSKLANIMFTYELSRRVNGVSVNCLHPGEVATGIVKDSPYLSRAMELVKDRLLTPDQGAETSVYLALSPEVENITGKYFINKQAVPSSEASYDPLKAKKLWDISEKMVNLT